MTTSTMIVRADSANCDGNRQTAGSDAQLIDEILESLEQRDPHDDEDGDYQRLKHLHNSRPWEFTDLQIGRMIRLEHQACERDWSDRFEWLRIVRGRIMIERPDRVAQVDHDRTAA